MKKTDSHRLLIVSSIDVSLIRFRGKLISELVAHGFQVFVAAPHFSDTYKAKLNELGTITRKIDLSPTGMSLAEDLRTVKQLYKLIKKEKIDLVFPYTMKPVMYTSLAARWAKISAVGMVSGLGYVFTGESFKRRLLKQLVIRIIQFSIAKNKAMVFQNPDDAALFKANNLIGRECHVTVVSGSGVDLEEFSWRPPRGEFQNIKFVFVARLLEDKGINLFLNAARDIKPQWPKAEFHIIGGLVPDTPNSVDLNTIERFSDEGFVHYHGHCSHIQEMLREMDVIVYPSWYREGVPRALLEALSVGLAVITTDMPGCRETVEQEVNGWMIQPKSQQCLNDAITKALENPQKLIEMSFNSRRLAENRFNVNHVNAIIVELLSSVADSERGVISCD